MKIVVLAGGLSTERDVSFKTGEMVTKALRENGHQVILLDVFMGYSNKEEDLTGIFDRAEAVSVKVDSNLAKADIRVSVKVAVLMGRVLHMIRTLNREITVMMETEVSQAAEISL